MFIGHSAIAIIFYNYKLIILLINLSLDVHTDFTYVLNIAIFTLQVIKLPMRLFYIRVKL